MANEPTDSKDEGYGETASQEEPSAFAELVKRVARSPNVALDVTIEDTGRSAASPVVDEWLGDRYHHEKILGHGGMGEVYLAVDHALDCEVALKGIAPELGEDSEGLIRLRDEVRLAQRITHPNVCRTYDLEEIEGTWFIKMEYIAGETLAERLTRGPLSEAAAVDVACQICAGLAAAHRQGIVHRDLKPHNIMIEDKSGRVVLMDFGIARVATSAERTARTVSGTPEYMAPEQVRGREVDGRADLYALGCVLYEMLSGERLFPGAVGMVAALAHAETPPPALPAAVPERLVRLLGRLLEKDPARRPAHAAEVAAALVEPRRPRRWLGLTVAAVAITAFGVGVLTLRPARRWQPQIRDLPAYDEHAWWTAISPDRTQFAYVSDREGPRGRIYVAPIDGGPSRAVSPRDGFDFIWAVRWSRDGQTLLFTDLSRQGYRVSASGGTPELIAEGVRDVEDCGGRILLQYVASPGCIKCPRLAVREADGTERDVVRLGAGEFAVNPTCDGNGRRVLYALMDLGASDVNLIRADLWMVAIDGGSPRRLTHDRADIWGVFAPDGRSIVFSSSRSGRRHLYEMPIDGSAEPTQLTFGDGWEVAPEVSRDGQLLLYSVDITSVQLFAQPMAGGPRRQLTFNLQDLHSFAVADDHTIIATALTLGAPARIVSVPLDGGEPVPLAEGQTPAVTSDGKEVVFSVTGTGRIMAIPRAGGRARLVTEVPGKIWSLGVGPDGRVHASVMRARALEAWSAPVAGGAAALELPPPWSWLQPAPRGGWRAAVRWLEGDRMRVRLLPPGAALDDPSTRELDVEGLFSAATWTTWMPDGGSLLHCRDGELHRFFVESGEDRALSVKGGIYSAVSPDGQTLYSTEHVPHVRRQLITNFADRPR